MAADYYAVLEVTATASPEEIRAAYRRLARTYHPDTNSSADAVVRMRQVNEAWETLRDPARRAAYDRTRPAARVAPRPVRRQAPRQRPSPTVMRAQRAWQEEEDAPRTSKRTYDGDPSVDWYAVLGVPPDAPRQRIQKRLGELASQMGGADISATEFTRRRNEMREAWSVLSDPHVRAAYDAARREYVARGGKPPAPPEERGPEMTPGYRQGPVVINGMFIDKGAVLAGADLRGADLRGLDLAGIVLRDAKLQGAELQATSLRRADLRGADLSGVSLQWADLGHADCTGATLRQANLANAAIHATKFVRANLAGASLTNSVGPGVNLDYADVSRADFTGAKVTPSLIARAKTQGTIMPDGTTAP